MSAQKSPKAIFRVMLASGDTQDHTYILSLNLGESKTFIASMVNMIQNALTHKKENYILFNNPLVYYNPDFVVSIKLSYVDCEECEDMVRSIIKGIFKPAAGKAK